MRVAIGFKSHSGWAVAVSIGAAGTGFELIDRRRIDLVDDPSSWLSKQPYHAAEDLDPKEADELVERAVASTSRNAMREMRDLVERLWQYGHEIAACAVLVPAPMPAWTTAEILAVHFRMHKAEGVLYPEALAAAARGSGLVTRDIREKPLGLTAADAFGSKLPATMDKLTTLGRSAGPPWARDQKNAALAAAIALWIAD